MLPTRKSEALLAFLALSSDRPHRRENLAPLLWGDVSPAQARQSLRQALSVIAKALGELRDEVLVLEPERVRVRPGSIDVDAIEFRDLAENGHAGDLAGAAALLRGELLEGLHVREARFDTWLSGERTRFHHLAIDTLLARLDAANAAGEDDDVVEAATALLGLDRTQEHAHRALMRLYRRQGRYGSALRQYNLCAGVLQEELGVEPDAETRQLCKEILVERARGVRRAAPEAPGTSRAPGLVLVLEQKPVVRTMLERTLAGAGYSVILAPDAERIPELGAGMPYAAVIAGVRSAFRRHQLVRDLQGRGYRGAVLFLTDKEPRVAASTAGPMRVTYVRHSARPSALISALRDVLRADEEA